MKAMLTKKDLVYGVSLTTGLTGDTASAAVTAVFDTITNGFRSGRGVSIRNFGKFELREDGGGRKVVTFTESSNLMEGAQ